MKRLIGAALAAIIAAAWLWYALDRLAAAQKDQAEAAVALQPPAVTAPRQLPATSEAEAQRSLARLTGDAAAQSAVRLSLAPLPQRLDGLALARIEAHGAEDKLRAFIDEIEAPTSPLRLTSWSISGDGAGGLRLIAEVAAPWRLAARAGAIPLDAAPAAPRAPLRTLFAVDQAADVRPAADAPPELIGIAGRLPDDAVALVRLPDGATRDLRIGESINGWRLISIAADRAGFARGVQRRDVVLPARE